jgi:hypothetical protein
MLTSTSVSGKIAEYTVQGYLQALRYVADE